MPGYNTSKKDPENREEIALIENTLRKIVRRILVETGHKWTRANDELLMLDQEGMEKEDRDNVSIFLKAMGMID